MKPTHTPEEYSTVCPYLMVDDLVSQLDFLITVFAAVVKEEINDKEGVMIHAEVYLGEVVVMMGLARPEWPARPSMNYIFVDNVDQIYESALAAGSKTIMEPGDRDYGLRESGFRDPQGNQWWIAQPLSE